MHILRSPGIPNLGNREEAHDDVRQTRRANHQRQCDTENIDLAFFATGVLSETQRRNDIVQLVEETDPADFAAKGELRNALPEIWIAMKTAGTV